MGGLVTIYQIFSKSTYRTYIGQTRRLEIRWKQHKNDLKRNKHQNIHLQRIFNKYGLQDLSFEIINEVEQEYADELEHVWIESMRNINMCINLSGDTSVRSLSEETKKKIGESHRGKKRSDDFKNAVSNSLKGRIFTEDHKRNLSISGRKRVPYPREAQSYESKERISRSNGFSPVYVLSPNDEVYLVTNLRGFSREHNLIAQNLGRVIKGQSEYHKGWRLYKGAYIENEQ